MIETDKIEYTDKSDEWPDLLKRKFEQFTAAGLANNFSIVCAVGINHGRHRASIIFSPSASHNPHIDQMCEDIAEMFYTMAAAVKPGVTKQ